MATNGDLCHAKLQELVDNFTPGGCYGIEWVLSGDSLIHKSHYNPAWRIEGVRRQGLQGLYTTESTRFTFEVGQGFVGKVFEVQKPLFVGDVQAPDPEEVKDAMQSWKSCYGSVFLRSELARKYGIRAAMFLPSKDGVREVGSVVKMTEVPRYFAPYHSSGMPPLAVAAGAPAGPDPKPESAAAPPAFLKPLVDEFTAGGCYAIVWAVQDDALVHQSHYNPGWRIEGVRKRGLGGLYTTESAAYTFAVGEGFVGKVFQAQEALFVRDLQEPDPEGVKDAIQSWGGAEFMRSSLAEKYGIRSALFIPSPSGVLEVGSSVVAPSAKEFFAEGAAEVLSGGGYAFRSGRAEPAV
uniref:Transcription factor MYC/MYB N-terminal domain-containing protein n=1 Tax=Alexandrium monilatum TaxID=311494 RepID=A0A7S4R6K5_9DINO